MAWQVVLRLLRTGYVSGRLHPREKPLGVVSCDHIVSPLLWKTAHRGGSPTPSRTCLSGRETLVEREVPSQVGSKR